MSDIDNTLGKIGIADGGVKLDNTLGDLKPKPLSSVDNYLISSQNAPIIETVPGTKISIRDSYNALSNILLNGENDGVAKAVSMKILQRMGYQNDNILANYDSIVSSLIGETGQHAKLDSVQVKKRLSDYISSAYQNSKLSEKAFDMKMRGIPIDDVMKQEYLNTATDVADIANSPLPKFYRDTIGNAFKAVAQAGSIFLSDSEKKYVQDALDGFLKFTSSFSAVMDVGSLEQNVGTVIGQVGAQITSPAMSQSVLAGTGVGVAAGALTGLGMAITIPGGLASGMLVGGYEASAKQEAGNMYLQLSTDKDFANVPDKVLWDYSMLYGSLSGALEVVPETMYPGVKQAIQKVAKAHLLTGEGASILKSAMSNSSIAKEAAKVGGAEFATEGAQGLLQNILTNAAIDEAASGDLKGKTLPEKIEITAGIMEQAIAGAQGGAFLGAFGAVPNAVRNRLKTTSEKLVEMPIAKPESVDNTTESTAKPELSNEDRPSWDTKDPSPIIGGKVAKPKESTPVPSEVKDSIFNALIYSGGKDGDVDIGTDKASLIASAQKPVLHLDATRFMSQIRKNFGDNEAIVDIISKAITSKNRPDEADVKLLKSRGIDIDSIIEDIATHLGEYDPPSYFAGALSDLGVSARTDDTIIQLRVFTENTKVIQNNPAAIELARKEGYKVVVWKDGDGWSGKILNAEGVSKVSQDKTNNDIVNAQKEAMAQMPAEKLYKMNQVARRRLSETLAKAKFPSEHIEPLINFLDKLSEVSSVNNSILHKMANVEIKVKNSLGTDANGSKILGKYDYSFHGEKTRGVGNISLIKEYTPITLLHEFIHLWQEQSPQEIKRELGRVYGFEMNYNEAWGEEEVRYWQSKIELIVDDFINYINTAQVKEPVLKKIFDEIGRFISSLIEEYFKRRVYFNKHDSEVKKFFDDLLEGKFKPYTKEEIEVAMSDAETVALFHTEGDFDLAKARAYVEAGEVHNIPTQVLAAFQEDDQMMKLYHKRLEEHELVFRAITQSKESLKKDFKFSENDIKNLDKLKDEIGLSPVDWDDKFKEFAKSDDNVSKIAAMIDKWIDKSSPIRSRLVPDWFDNSQQAIAKLRRDISRKTAEYREAFWHSMAMSGDMVYAKAAAMEADHIHMENERSFIAGRETDFETIDPDQGSVIEGFESSSNKKIQDMIFSQANKIAELEGELEKLKLEKGATTKRLRSITNKLYKSESEKYKRLLKSKKEAEIAMKRLSRISGDGIDMEYADAIDFLASISSKYKTQHQHIRDRYSLGMLKALVAKRPDLGIDIKLVEAILKESPDKIAIGDINKLIVYKRSLMTEGRLVRERKVEELRTSKVAEFRRKIIANYYSRGLTEITEEAAVAIFKTNMVKKFVARGIPARDVIDLLAYNDPKDIPKAVREHNRVVKQKAFETAYTSGLTDEAEIKEFAKAIYDRNSIRKLDELGIRRELDAIDNGNIEGLIQPEYPLYGSYNDELTRSGLKPDFLNIGKRLGLDPLRMAEYVDGMVTNGPIRELFYDQVRGGNHLVGVENSYLQAYRDVEERFLAKMKELGITPKDLSEKIVFEVDTGRILSRKEAKKIDDKEFKKSESTRKYAAYDRDQIMEMYSAFYSGDKMNAVRYGSGIPIDVIRSLVDNMDGKDKALADWIMAEYAKVSGSLRDSWEIHSGKKMNYSAGGYSPIVRIRESWDEDIDVENSSRKYGIGMDQGNTNDRIKMLPIHQTAIKLGMTSNFFTQMKKTIRIIKVIHVTDIIRDVMGFGGSLSDEQKQIQNIFIKSFGEKNLKYFQSLYKDIVTERSMEEEIGEVSKIGLQILRNMQKSVIGLMLKSVVMQSFALLNSLAYMDNKLVGIVRMSALLGKFFIDYFSGKTLLKRVYEQSGMMWYRTFDPAMREYKESKIRGMDRRVSKISNIVMAPMLAMDEITAATVWEARRLDKLETLKKEQKNLSDSERLSLIVKNEIEAVNSATEMVSKTQPNSDILSTPEFFKRDKVLSAFIMPFSQSIYKVWNQVTHDVPLMTKTMFSKTATKRARLAASSAIATIISTQVIGGIAAFFLAHWRLPESDDDWYEVLMNIFGVFGISGKLTVDASSAISGNYDLSRSQVMPLAVKLAGQTFTAGQKFVKDPNANNFALLALEPTAMLGFPVRFTKATMIRAVDSIENGDFARAVYDAYGGSVKK